MSVFLLVGPGYAGKQCYCEYMKRYHKRHCFEYGYFTPLPFFSVREATTL